ncbi:exopolysaccharide biosynthesis polyprenyl glycosylphosphotransferase [Thermus scotoductus]|uniref:Exopolysaccharide biosynthesis polyprenyl glycosylphosphotransferase n=1 Tax=Thermus scotoductus TaxID=37636 RepID=A0A430RP23_THESC|nr:undecaprenyl-phosphate galactose phosphotransferase WbaP [Thermus scotoductus]RTH20691.1 exopolysaccharide biosynthesis polyprenyl glycosylphosphotransferase [Thermus scotoductus]
MRIKAKAIGKRVNVSSAFPRLAVPGLLLADLLALEASLLLGYATREVLGFWFPAKVPLEVLRSVSLALLIFPFGYALAGLYPGYGLVPVERVRRQVQLTFVSFLVLISWEWLFLREGWSRGVLGLAMGYALVLVPLMAALAREVLVRLGAWGAPVVILGAGKSGALVARSLRAEPALGLRPTAFLDDDPAKWGVEVEGLPVLGSLDLASHLAQKGFRYTVLAMPGVGRERMVDLVNKLPFPHGILVPDLFGVQSLWVSTRDLAGVLGLEVKKNLLVRRNRLLKRALDYLLGLPLFLVSLPFLALLALWIKRVSPGPAFYAQEREGYMGRTIRVWKLRTMYPDAERRLEEYLERNPEAREEWLRFFKLKDDPRVLPGIGHFLRKTSLDELPQLFNVLKGEMSLVGPRPFPRYHLEKFPEDFRALRRSVPPGITGLWQVSARSEGDLEVQQALDTYYIRNWSLWFDLYLLARTVWVVLTRKGAY